MGTMSAHLNMDVIPLGRDVIELVLNEPAAVGRELSYRGDKRRRVSQHETRGSSPPYDLVPRSVADEVAYETDGPNPGSSSTGSCPRIRLTLFSSSCSLCRRVISARDGLVVATWPPTWPPA